MPNKTVSPNVFQAFWRFKQVKIAVYSVVLVLILVLSSYLILAKVLTPVAIEQPKYEHLHFRMQFVYHGKAENFGEDKYQTPYDKDACSAAITHSPIHFHDNKDQFVHIHWKNITGGMVLKYYGLNLIGGLDNYMGFRFDNFPSKIEPVKIHGKVLPTPGKDDKFFIFTGDESGFSEKSPDDWKNKTLEDFFEKKSLVAKNENETSKSLFSYGSLQALAHGNEKNDSKSENSAEPSQEELKEINNLLGNVVIFVQKERPSDEQIKEKFKNLVPLGKSTCGG